MELIIHFNRPGKGTSHYVEMLVDENLVRLKTRSVLSQEFSRTWCEEVWWPQGMIPRGVLVGAVVKYLFFNEWFSVMELLGTQGEHLGYYIDIDTPMEKKNGEYYLIDLFLDLWIGVDGRLVKLDEEQFEGAFQAALMSSLQYTQARQVFEEVILEITSGEFLKKLH
jgi:hypothetical protein